MGRPEEEGKDSAAASREEEGRHDESEGERHSS